MKHGHTIFILKRKFLTSFLIFALGGGLFVSSLTAFSKVSLANSSNSTHQNAQNNQNAQDAQDTQDIPGPFYGGLNVNSPLLEVGKYASLQITATNASGVIVDANSSDATTYSGTLTLNIPFNEVLNATKQQMEYYKDQKAKLDFSYSLSLPEPIEWQENVEVKNHSSLVKSASAKISTRHKNTIKLIANLAENTWEKLYNSNDHQTVKLTAHFSFTKSSLEQVQNKNITGTGILNLYKKEKDKDGENWVPGFGFTYITHELNIPLLGGKSTISNPLDTTKQDYSQLIYSKGLTDESKNKDIKSTGTFEFSGTAQKVTYEDYSTPLTTRDGLEINAKISSKPFKSSLENVEKWLKTKINDVSRVYVSDLNVSIKLTFKLPKQISLSPSIKLPDDPLNHYPIKEGGVRNDPTSLLGDYGDFALKDVQEHDNTITATAYLKDWYRGDQLMRPYAYSYDEIKHRINNLVNEINIKFIPVWFNTDAEAGKTYEIEGSAQGELSGKINYVYRRLGAYDTDKLIPFNVKFGEEDVEIPVVVPYKVTFKFESGTPGQTLPDYINKQYELKPINVYNGNSITIDNSTLRKTTNELFDPYPEVVGYDKKMTGTWVFDELAGWKIDGKGEPVTTIKNVDKNITLVGTWKFIPVEDSAHRKVTFKDGENTIATVEVEAGKTIEGDSLENQSMPANPTKAGYTFKEWNTKEDGTGTKFLGTTAVISDITVYAVYTKDSDPENPQDPQNPQNPQDPNNNSGNGSDTNDSDKSESDSINIPSLNLDNGLADGSNSHENASYQSNNVNNQNKRNNKSESLESSNSNQTNDSANSNKSGAKKLGFAKKNTLPKMGADNSLALAITALITIAALTTLLAKFIAKTRR